MSGDGLQQDRPSRRMALIVSLLLGSALALACERKPAPEEQAPPRRPPAAAEEPPPALPWFAGTWRAELELQAAAPQEGAGLPREWKEDPGGGLGPATLSLTIDAERQVTGILEGALHLRVRGLLEEDTLRARLTPEPSQPEPSQPEPSPLEPPQSGDAAKAPREEAPPRGAPGSSKSAQDAAPATFRGTLVASPEGTVEPERAPPGPPPTLVGTLRLSSGDSLRIRHARVSLERTSPPRGAASPPSP